MMVYLESHLPGEEQCVGLVRDGAEARGGSGLLIGGDIRG